MGKSKKYLACFVAVILLLSAMPFGTLNVVSRAANPVLQIGQNLTADLSSGEMTFYFDFTPTETTYYRFFSISNTVKVIGSIFDPNGHQIARHEPQRNRTEFSVGAVLQANNTYRLCADVAWNDTDSFQVGVEKTKGIVNVEINTMPIKTEYIRGIWRPLDLQGLSLKAIWSDSSTTIWHYIKNDYENYLDGDRVEVDSYDYENTGEARIMFRSFEIPLNLTLVDNPVKSISLVNYKPLEIYEKYEGEERMRYDEATNSEVPFFYYYIDEGALRNTITVKIDYNDGTSKQVSANSEIDGMEFVLDNNQTSVPWKLGTNYLTLEFMNFTCKVPVKVVENPVKSVEILNDPNLKVIENIDGSEDWGDNALGEWTSYFKYDVKNAKNIDKVTVKINYKNGTSKVGALGDEIDGHKIFLEDTQTCAAPWKLGDNFAEVSFLGVRCRLKVQVIETPIKNIEVTKAPTKIYMFGNPEYTTINGDKNGWVSPKDLTGLEFRVNYKDGSSKTYTYKDIIPHGDPTFEEYMVDGYIFSIGTFFPDENSQPFSGPGVFQREIQYLGFTAKYDVTVIESDVSAIRVVNPPTKTTWENIYFPDVTGIKIEVSYKNGKKETVASSSTNTKYLSEYGDIYAEMKTPSGRPITVVAERPSQDPEIMGINVRCFDRVVNVQGINLIPANRVSEFELENANTSGNNMTIQATYVDGAKKTISVDPVCIYAEDVFNKYYVIKTEKGYSNLYVSATKNMNNGIDRYYVSYLNSYARIRLTSMQGDYNGDDVVDYVDYQALVNVSLKTTASPEENKKFDYSCDGTVDVLDLHAFLTIMLQEESGAS